MTLHLTHLRSDVSQLGLALRGGASDFMVMVMVMVIGIILPVVRFFFVSFFVQLRFSNKGAVPPQLYGFQFLAIGSVGVDVQNITLSFFECPKARVFVCRFGDIFYHPCCDHGSCQYVTFVSLGPPCIYTVVVHFFCGLTSRSDSMSCPSIMGSANAKWFLHKKRQRGRLSRRYSTIDGGEVKARMVLIALFLDRADGTLWI